jgi:Zn-dependent protease
MFTRQIELFKLFGVSIKIDLSWFIIVVLLVWSLAVGYFPMVYPDLAEGPASWIYWWMGLAGTIGLFASVVFHELAHALMARQYGLPMKGITLFIFGGVAEMTEEPPTAISEFMVAIAGPIASVIVSIASFGLAILGANLGWPTSVNGVLWYLGFINAVLVAFNIIPAFPLDGGRVLRSILWHFKGNLRWATRITSAIGSAFGILLIVLGVVQFIMGNFIGGIWMALLGMFLRGAAQMSYQQLLVRRALEGEPVRRFMHTDVQSVEPDISLQDLVEDYVYRYHYKMFPVVENGNVTGCVTTRNVRDVPREQWSRTKVREIAVPCDQDNSIDVSEDAMDALKKMSQTGASRLMVLEDGHLRGIISLKDMLKFISLKVELEEDGTAQLPPHLAPSDADTADLREEEEPSLQRSGR